MDWILKAIIIIIVSYFIIAPKIEFIREYKRKKKELREEGDFPRLENANREKTLQLMIISSLVITIILLYVSKAEISISTILAGFITIILVESIIGSLWAFGREFILIYKKKGIFVAAFTLIFTIIILVGMMYVKYKNLILRG